MDRRAFLQVTSASALLVSCSGEPSAPEKAPEKAVAAPVVTPPRDPTVIRVASVKTAVEGGLLPQLVAQFEATAPYRVQVTTGESVYGQARAGNADLVVSHFGHKEAEAFVLDGLGEWPRTVFSNQMALVGPLSDPAGVRGLGDAGEAMRRIAAKRIPFVVNDLDGVRYLTEILWNAAGKPARDGWMIDEQTSRAQTLQRAAALGGYTLWGLTPFVRTVRDLPLALEPLVIDDPLLQRMMVTVVVKPTPHGTNRDGALALQAYLLAPATQAAIRTIHYPGADTVSWVPAGRHNRSAMLPKT